MLSTLLVVALAQAAAATPAVAQESVDGPVLMSMADIRAYNAKLTRDDPAYIRCERSVMSGSLVRKQTSCRTNAEWRRVHEVGNDDARYTVDNVQSHQSTRDPSELTGRPQVGG